eukprot:gene1860-2187_t
MIVGWCATTTPAAVPVLLAPSPASVFSRRTNHLGVTCVDASCRGTMIQEYDKAALYTQLKYIETLFDIPRLLAKKSLAAHSLSLNSEDLSVIHLLKTQMSKAIEG